MQEAGNCLGLMQEDIIYARGTGLVQQGQY
jgi:hypothetical protein